MIGKVDVISINDEEARQLTEKHSLVEAAKVIQDMGPKYVIIKKGEHGALLFHENKYFVHLDFLWKRFLIQLEQEIVLLEVFGYLSQAENFF